VSARDLIEYVLLTLGVGIEVLCALGVLVMSNVYDRLHYVGAASFGALFVALAILVRDSFSLIADKALLVAVLMLASGPAMAHATARAVRVREHGHWSVQESERIEADGR
jgi:monovalent cation/proton antiporter MnhG/PhaG subunit